MLNALLIFNVSYIFKLLSKNFVNFKSHLGLLHIWIVTNKLLPVIMDFSWPLLQTSREKQPKVLRVLCLLGAKDEKRRSQHEADWISPQVCFVYFIKAGGVMCNE